MESYWSEALLVIIILVNLSLVASSRLRACIRLAAFHGIACSAFALVSGGSALFLHGAGLALVASVLKGLVFPWLLVRALRESRVSREVEPLVGYVASTLACLAMLAGSIWVGTRLTLPSPAISTLVVPVALFTILVGLFLIVSRTKALTQVIGYLVLENGIFVFGVALVRESPLLVEFGVLLDVFVAVFVMGITVFHIGRTFDDVDTSRLSSLKDWTP
jgi:hydrogenase-4 component E